MNDVDISTPDLCLEHDDKDFGKQNIHIGVAADGTLYFGINGKTGKEDLNFHATSAELDKIVKYLKRRQMTIKRNKK
jgi:hypothetical protein